MRKLIALSILTISLHAFPSGKAVFTPQYFTAHKKLLPQAGISVYENIFPGVYYDSYFGLGISPRFSADNVYWMVVRNDVGFPLSDRADLKIGATIRFSQQDIAVEDETNIHAAVVYSLW